MLVARGRAKCGNEAVADAHLGKGPEGRGLCAVVLANGPDEPEHPLLDQVLAVAARQKERARARAHKTGIAPDKRFLRLAAAVGSAAAERLVRGLHRGISILCHIYHTALYLYLHGFVKYLRK